MTSEEMIKSNSPYLYLGDAALSVLAVLLELLLLLVNHSQFPVRLVDGLLRAHDLLLQKYGCRYCDAYPYINVLHVFRIFGPI
jgi:hypothetical protein